MLLQMMTDAHMVFNAGWLLYGLGFFLLGVAFGCVIMAIGSDFYN